MLTLCFSLIRQPIHVTHNICPNIYIFFLIEAGKCFVSNEWNENSFVTEAKERGKKKKSPKLKLKQLQLLRGYIHFIFSELTIQHRERGREKNCRPTLIT